MKSAHPVQEPQSKTPEARDIRDKTPNQEPVGTGSVSPENAKPVEALSAEEQMAQYEDALKEEDWGHQPC